MFGDAQSRRSVQRRVRRIEFMKTVTIQIGNTDDKLTQRQWHSYVERMNHFIYQHAKRCHFFGGCSNWEEWQNVAWVVTVEPHKLEVMKDAVRECRREFGQDSAAWTDGDTLFV